MLLVVLIGVTAAELLNAAGACELGIRASNKPTHLALTDSSDPAVLRRRVEGRSPISAYLLGFKEADPRSILVLRNAAKDQENPLLSFMALEALCRLGTDDLIREGPERMKALSGDQRMAARIAAARLAGILATNGIYDGWTYVRNILVNGDMKSVEFSDALQRLGNFKGMKIRGQSKSVYEELLQTVPRVQTDRRERIQQWIPSPTK